MNKKFNKMILLPFVFSIFLYQNLAHSQKLELSGGIHYSYSENYNENTSYLHGLGGNIILSWQVNDLIILNVDIPVSFTLNSEDYETIIYPSLEFCYMLDVLRIIPYFGVGISGYGLIDIDSVQYGGGIKLLAGFEYLISRSLTIGAKFGYYMWLSDFQNMPITMNFSIYIGWIWELLNDE